MLIHVIIYFNQVYIPDKRLENGLDPDDSDDDDDELSDTSSTIEEMRDEIRFFVHAKDVLFDSRVYSMVPFIPLPNW